MSLISLDFPPQLSDGSLASVADESHINYKRLPLPRLREPMNFDFKLSTTQIGRIAESLVASTLILASGGRLSPFTALSDDCGVDLVVLDKMTSRTLCIQVKCRSENDRRRSVQYGVRKASFRSDTQRYLLAFPFNPKNPALTQSWFIPMVRLPEVAVEKKDRYAISPSTAAGSRDRCSKYRRDHVSDLVAAIFEALEGSAPVVDARTA